MRIKDLRNILSIALALCGTISYAQDLNTPDGLFAAARKAAFDKKDYTQAIGYSKQALAIAPGYTDIKVFLGRVYAWTGRPDSARHYLKQAIADKPEYADIYAAYGDLEYWNKNDSASLALVNIGLRYEPQSTGLLVRKARVLERMREWQEAAETADAALQLDKKNSEARAIATRLANYLAYNAIGVTYDYVYFSNNFDGRKPWNYASIFYTRQTKLGSVSPRINYANRFGSNGLQYELESYPKISRTFYAYAAAAYSSDDAGVFPKWRAGASLYANLPKSFEGELGIRYLRFDTTDIFTYTTSFGKYYRNFLFGARAFLTPKQSYLDQAYLAYTRYYFKSADDFFGVNAGYGISPDDRALIPQLNIGDRFSEALNAFRFGIDVHYSIHRLNIITLNAWVINQEFFRAASVITNGNQIQAGIGYIRRF